MMRKFQRKINAVYFLEDIQAMEINTMIKTYSDPKVVILGPRLDYGPPHPDDVRRPSTREKKVQYYKEKMLLRLQSFGNYY